MLCYYTHRFTDVAFVNIHCIDCFVVLFKILVGHSLDVALNLIYEFKYLFQVQLGASLKMISIQTGMASSSTCSLMYLLRNSFEMISTCMRNFRLRYRLNRAIKSKSTISE